MSIGLIGTFGGSQAFSGLWLNAAAAQRACECTAVATERLTIPSIASCQRACSAVPGNRNCGQ